MGMWTVVIVGIVVATALFLLACVSPKGDNALSRLRRFVFSTLPATIERLSVRVFGPRFFPAIRYYVAYPFEHLTPIFQLTYLSIAFYGFYVFWIYGFSRLPNPYFSTLHIYTGSAAFVVTIVVFVLANTTPPGQVTRETLKYYQKTYKYDEVLFKETLCPICKIARPARSKHCRICNICVPRFDHHCIWINGCVGEGNYKHFLCFLLATTLICVYAEIVAASILVTEIQRDGLLSGYYYDALGNAVPATYLIMLRYLVQKQPSFMFILLLCVLMSVALGGFLIHHCYLASHNTTSYERAKRLDQIYAIETRIADHPEEAASLQPQIDSISLNRYHKSFLSNWREVFE